MTGYSMLKWPMLKWPKHLKLSRAKRIEEAVLMHYTKGSLKDQQKLLFSIVSAQGFPQSRRTQSCLLDGDSATNPKGCKMASCIALEKQQQQESEAGLSSQPTGRCGGTSMWEDLAVFALLLLLRNLVLEWAILYAEGYQHSTRR